MKKILPVALFAAFALLLAGGSDPAHVQRGDGGGFHGGGGFHDGGFRGGVGFRGASAFRGVFVGGFRGDGFRSGWGWGWGLGLGLGWALLVSARIRLFLLPMRILVRSRAAALPPLLRSISAAFR